MGTGEFNAGGKPVMDIRVGEEILLVASCYRNRDKRRPDDVSCFTLHFFRALAASCVLYNRTEHSQGFSIC